jgi:hypothetical protein
VSLGFGVQHVEEILGEFWRKSLNLTLRSVIGKNEMQRGFWVPTEHC